MSDGLCRKIGRETEIGRDEPEIDGRGREHLEDVNKVRGFVPQHEKTLIKTFVNNDDEVVRADGLGGRGHLTGMIDELISTDYTALIFQVITLILMKLARLRT